MVVLNLRLVSFDKTIVAVVAALQMHFMFVSIAAFKLETRPESFVFLSAIVAVVCC